MHGSCPSDGGSEKRRMNLPCGQHGLEILFFHINPPRSWDDKLRYHEEFDPFLWVESDQTARRPSVRKWNSGPGRNGFNAPNSGALGARE